MAVGHGVDLGPFAWKWITPTSCGNCQSLCQFTCATCLTSVTSLTSPPLPFRLRGLPARNTRGPSGSKLNRRHGHGRCFDSCGKPTLWPRLFAPPVFHLITFTALSVCLCLSHLSLPLLLPQPPLSLSLSFFPPLPPPPPPPSLLSLINARAERERERERERAFLLEFK